jgi:hypothetical protein
MQWNFRLLAAHHSIIRPMMWKRGLYTFVKKSESLDHAGDNMQVKKNE